MRSHPVAATLALALATSAVAAQTSVPLDDVLGKVGARVEEYFARAQRMVFVEKTTIFEVGSSMAPEGFGRVLESDLRVEWDPAADGPDGAEAKVVRELRKVNGRTPRVKDDRNCLDPNPISPEPLGFLLPSQRADFTFKWIGRGKGKEQNAILVDYRARKTGPPEVKQPPDKREGCFSVSFPGGVQGRVWIDAETYEVLRVDERLNARMDFRIPDDQRRFGFADVLVLERHDTSIRYKPVAFHDPEETMLLPESIDTLTVYRGAQSHRSRQVFSDYRRFVTGGRLVK